MAQPIGLFDGLEAKALTNLIITDELWAPGGMWQQQRFSYHIDSSFAAQSSGAQYGHVDISEAQNICCAAHQPILVGHP